MSKELSIYWFSINAEFVEPLTIFDEANKDTGEKAYGFYKELGVTANSKEKAKSLLLKYIINDEEFEPSQLVISYEHEGIIHPEDLQKEIYSDMEINNSLIQTPENEGVWYSSGCGFYNDRGS